MEACHQQK